MLGCFYLRRGTGQDTEKAITAFKRALFIRKRLFGAKNIGISNILQNIGLAYKQQASNAENRNSLHRNQLELATVYFRESFQIIKCVLVESEIHSREWTGCCIEAVKNLFQYLAVTEIRADFDLAPLILQKILHILCSIKRVVFEEGKSKGKLQRERNTVYSLVSKAWTKFAYIHYLHHDKNVESMKCLLKSSLSRESVWRKDAKTTTDDQTKLCQANLWLKFSCHRKSIRLFETCSKSFENNIILHSFPLIQMGRSYSSLRDDERALKAFTKAEHILRQTEKNPTLILQGLRGILHHYLSLIYQRRRDNVIAFDHANKAISSIEDIISGDSSCLSFIEGTPSEELSIFLHHQNWSLRGLECYAIIFQLGFMKSQQQNKIDVLSDILQRIGSIYTGFGSCGSDKSLQMFLSVLSFREVHDENDLTVGDLLFNIGNLYLQQGENALAKLCHEESYRISSHVFGRDSTELIESSILLAQICYNLCQYEESDRRLNDAMDLIQYVPKDADRNVLSYKILWLKVSFYLIQKLHFF